MTLALRSIAVAIAIAGVLDPAFGVTRPGLPVVEVRAGSESVSRPDAAALRQRTIDALDAIASVNAPGTLAAVVLIEPSLADVQGAPAGLPISIVRGAGRGAAGLRVVRVAPPAPVLPGQSAVVHVEVEATGLEGQAARISLEQDGVELAAVAHTPAGNHERFHAELQYAPPAGGIHATRVVARAANTEDSADVGIVARARMLRVLMFEPRPSWASTFVRRAIEQDPVFEVAALARPSRGIDVSTGAAPARLTASALAPYDAVVVGAPEALTDSEVRALETFARERGGAVVLVPDRPPSGAYRRLLPATFDDTLLESAIRLEAGVHIQASELALAAAIPPGSSALATLRQGARSRPVILSWPVGIGRIVFSGALDAWRFRDATSQGFARFWRGAIGNLAAAAPRPLELSVHPAVAPVGGRIAVRLAVRPTEFDTRGDRVELPGVSAELIAADGAARQVRLWPTAERGVFEGEILADAPGEFDLRASAGGHAADAPLMAIADARGAATSDIGLAGEAVRASGGVDADAGDLRALVAHVRALARPERRADVHPMRSPWWMAPFAAALFAEWTLRRRRGLR